MFILSLQGAIELGIIYAVMALGVFISFRTLNMPDLTVDGSFTLGAATYAMMSIGGHPYLGLIIAFIAGGIAGSITALLNTKLKIQPLLAGILMMLALYSINLRVMGNRANVNLLNKKTVFSILDGTILEEYNIEIISLGILIIILVLLFFFLETKFGFVLRATGDNKDMVKALGVNTDFTILIGLAISNGLVALSGALIASEQLFADVSMGIGMVVIGLASVIIGEVIFGTNKLLRRLIAVILGAILYRIIIAFVLYLGMPSTDLKLISAIIVAIALSMPAVKQLLLTFKKRRLNVKSNKIKNKESRGKRMLKINSLKKTFGIGSINEKIALNNINLSLDEGEFVTIIGGNGAGKSTLLNCIAGEYSIDEGNIILDSSDITFTPEYKCSRKIGRVFQDPLRGTAFDMTIEENLAIAYAKDKKRGLSSGINKKDSKFFKERLALLDLGLEDRIKQKVGLLSGGQRQALTLLMATIVKPKLLLLDEHTAALDPSIAKKVLYLTKEVVAQNNLCTMMITHNMEDALKYGTRTIMMHEGQIIFDIKGKERENMTVESLIEQFGQKSGTKLDNDRMLLSN